MHFRGTSGSITVWWTPRPIRKRVVGSWLPPVWHWANYSKSLNVSYTSKNVGDDSPLHVLIVMSKSVDNLSSIECSAKHEGSINGYMTASALFCGCSHSYCLEISMLFNALHCCAFYEIQSLSFVLCCAITVFHDADQQVTVSMMPASFFFLTKLLICISPQCH